MTSLKGIESAAPVASWHQRAGVWLGIGINPGSITIGGTLGAQIPLRYLLFLIPVGALALFLLTVTQGLISRHRREPLAKRASTTFGLGAGYRLLNLLMAFGMIGWGSFYVGLAGFSLADMLSLPGWLGALLIAGSIYILSELGLNRWNSLVWLTTLAALGVAIVALVAVGAQPTLTETSDGFGVSEALWVIGSVVAYAIMFTLRCSDFTWDLASDWDVIKVGLSLFIPLIISMLIGAILFQAVGDWNLADILARTDLALLGQLFLLASIASPTLSGLHSGSLAIGSLTPLGRKQSAAIICMVSFILGATRFDYQLRPFLDLMGSILLPALALTLVTVRLKQKPTSITAFVAWLSGAGVALVFRLQGQLVYIIAGAAVSLAVLFAIMYVTKANKLSDGTVGG